MLPWRRIGRRRRCYRTGGHNSASDGNFRLFLTVLATDHRLLPRGILRHRSIRMWSLATLVVLLLAVAGFGYGALHYMTAVPGQTHSGELKPLTADETALAAALKRHIATIAARE